MYVATYNEILVKSLHALWWTAKEFPLQSLPLQSLCMTINIVIA